MIGRTRLCSASVTACSMLAAPQILARLVDDEDGVVHHCSQQDPEAEHGDHVEGLAHEEIAYRQTRNAASAADKGNDLGGKADIRTSTREA